MLNKSYNEFKKLLEEEVTHLALHQKILLDLKIVLTSGIIIIIIFLIILIKLLTQLNQIIF